MDQQTAKHSPQSYTQKLIDAGVIEFLENDIDEETDEYQWIVYQILPDFIVLYFDEDYMNNPCLIGNIVERYYCDDNADSKYKFESFEVYPYDDVDTNDITNPEEEIKIYKNINL